jgi:hypothetical protein
VPGSDRNFSQFVGIDDEEEYNELLVQSNLGRWWGKKSKRPSVSKDTWQRFVVEHDLPEQYEMSDHRDSTIAKDIRYLLWIKLGAKISLSVDDYNPTQQMSKVPPIKITTCAKLERKYNSSTNAGNSTLVSTVGFIMKMLQQIEEEDRMADQENGDAADDGCGESSVNDDVAGSNNESTTKIAISSTLHPTLHKLTGNQCIEPSTLYALIRDLVKISKDESNGFQFGHESLNGTRRTVIIVPKVSNNRSFAKLVPPKVRELQRGLVSDWHCRHKCKELVKEKQRRTNIILSQAEEEKVLKDIEREEEKVMVSRIINYYCRHETETFVEVAKDNGIYVENKKMSKEFAAAMFSEANIGATASRVLNRYLTAFHGRRIMPPESEIYRGELSDDKLPPQVLSHVLKDKTKVHYYVKNLSSVIAEKLQQEISKTKDLKDEDLKRTRKLEIIYSADYGGGHFRISIKCRLRYTNSRGKRRSLSFTHRIGQMQCKKNTYYVLSETVAPLMNEGLKEILQEDKKTAKSVRIIKEGDANYTIVIGSVIEQGEGDVLVDITPGIIKLAITGDLAFYAVMQGKPSMDRNWCPLCQLGHNEWSVVHKCNGDLWTWELMDMKLNEVRIDAALAKPKMKPKERKGIKDTRLLDIDNSLYVIPVLHIKLGIVNRAFIKSDGNSYLSWSEKRVENIPEQERVAYNLYRDSDDKLLDMNETKLLFYLMNGEEMLEKKELLKRVTRQLTNRQLSMEDRNSLQRDKEQYKQEYGDLAKKDKEIATSLKTLRAERKTFKSAYETEKKKRTYHCNMIQNQKELLMKEIGVDRGAAHGGDLQGRGCTALVQNATMFFSECEKIDLQASKDGTSAATEDEIKFVNKKYKQLAILTDAVLHYIYMDLDDVETYEGNFAHDYNAYLVAFVWLWNYVRLSMLAPKFHALKDHSEAQFVLWQAIGSFNEEFGEADHSLGNLEHRRFCSVRDQGRRAQLISRNQEMKNHISVKREQTLISPPGKKRRKNNMVSVEVTMEADGVDEVVEVFDIIEIRKKALEEIQQLMDLRGNDPAQMEDFYNKKV